jgi:riboflavin synthase
MFTGLVEGMGEVLEAEAVAEGRRIRVRAGVEYGDLARGQSIAINGVCQTVIATGSPGEGFWFEMISIPETLARTNFGSFTPGRRVNLERPLRMGDRLGGHWVQGHVDATGAIEEIVRREGACSTLVSVPRALSRFIVEKGSIAIDGVSLTVGQVFERRDSTCFWVHLIPETLERTVFGIYQPGDAVNIEADLIGKHVVRALEASGRIPPAEGSDQT